MLSYDPRIVVMIYVLESSIAHCLMCVQSNFLTLNVYCVWATRARHIVVLQNITSFSVWHTIEENTDLISKKCTAFCYIVFCICFSKNVFWNNFNGLAGLKTALNLIDIHHLKCFNSALLFFVKKKNIKKNNLGKNIFKATQYCT